MVRQRGKPPGDILIIATFAIYNEIELAGHEPDTDLRVDSQNCISAAATRFRTQAAA